MPLNLHDDHGRRYPTYRPDRSGLPLAARLSEAFWIAVAIAAGLFLYHWSGALFGPLQTRLLARPMDASTFNAIRENSVPWTFTYLLPGEAQLTLSSTSMQSGAPVQGSFDLLDDGQPPFAAAVPADIREPLFRAVLDYAGDFFGGGIAQEEQGRRFSSPSDWPYRPLFLFQVDGPTPNAAYVLAFGGDPKSPALPRNVERVQRAVNGLKQYIRAFAPGPGSTTTTASNAPRFSSGGSGKGVRTDARPRAGR